MKLNPTWRTKMIYLSLCFSLKKSKILPCFSFNVQCMFNLFTCCSSDPFKMDIKKDMKKEKWTDFAKAGRWELKRATRLVQRYLVCDMIYHAYSFWLKKNSFIVRAFLKLKNSGFDNDAGVTVNPHPPPPSPGRFTKFTKLDTTILCAWSASRL